MTPAIRLPLLLPLCLLGAPLTVAHGQVLQQRMSLLGSFDTGWRAPWQERRLASRVNRFAVVEDNGELVLRADSDGAASALWRALTITSLEAGQLSWRWKIAGTVEGLHREREKDGDDYAARVFVVFDGDLTDRDTRALCYVWATHEPIGSVFPSPYVPTVATFVLESGNSRAGQWIGAERDVMADYEAVFGGQPERITGVALMVDTDNTRSRLTTYFDDLVLRYRTRHAEPAGSGRPGEPERR
jgi:hypothetical protein